MHCIYYSNVIIKKQPKLFISNAFKIGDRQDFSKGKMAIACRIAYGNLLFLFFLNYAMTLIRSYLQL